MHQQTDGFVGLALGVLLMKFIIYKRLLQPLIANLGASYYTITVILVDQLVDGWKITGCKLHMDIQWPFRGCWGGCIKQCG